MLGSLKDMVLWSNHQILPQARNNPFQTCNIKGQASDAKL